MTRQQWRRNVFGQGMGGWAENIKFKFSFAPKFLNCQTSVSARNVQWELGLAHSLVI